MTWTQRNSTNWKEQVPDFQGTQQEQQSFTSSDEQSLQRERTAAIPQTEKKLPLFMPRCKWCRTNTEKKSEPQFRTRLTQTGAILGSDFYFELAAATQEKKERKNPKEALGERGFR